MKRVPAIHEKTWRIWLKRHPRDWIEERVKWYEWQVKQDPKTRTGWLVNAIREEWVEAPRGYNPDDMLSLEERDDKARQRWLEYGKKLEAEGIIEPADKLAAAADDFRERHGIDKPPAKPGEPDAKHAGGAPVTAGLHERRTA
jgi:hypothetical protein